MSSILIVEDNPMNRMLVRDILAHRGHETREACNVAEAESILREADVPDIVLLDVQIPGGGGEAVLRAMRADPRYAEVPIVAVTAFAMSGDRERLLAAGFDAYVSKPIDTRVFGPTVESLIGSKKR